MSTLKNFMLGLLLAAVLMGPVAWAQAGQMVRTGLVVAAAQFGHSAQPLTIPTTVHAALVRAR